MVDAEQPVFAEARVQYPIELGAIVDFDQHIQLPVSREPIQRFQPLGAERGRDQPHAVGADRASLDNQIRRASGREGECQYVEISGDAENIKKKPQKSITTTI